jgi:hypothetical protein
MLGAQPPPDDPVAALRAELDELRRQYEERLEALDRRLTELEAENAALREAAATEPPPSEPPTAAVAPAEPPGGEPPATAIAAAEPTAASAPAPLTLASGAAGKNFLNLSLDGLVAAGSSTAEEVEALQTGGHDPAQRGFTLQNLEVVFESAVDPYFRGQANVILQITPEGETLVELEEAFATTSSLPHGLQVKGGQFLTEFGRLNPTHPHSWDFVDQPLVNGRFFGPDGLRSVGARLSWLMPTDFYSEALVALQNSHGETLSSFRSLPGETLFGRDIVETGVSTVSDLLVVPRYTTSFDLSDTQTLLLGASAALGPNGTGDSNRSRIYGVDAFWKWKSPTAFRGFPFLKLQGELMHREVSTAAAPEQELAAETFRDWGGYLQLNWGYRPGHVVGLRLDNVDGDLGNPEQPGLARRFRLSPVLTWFPTEYSKLRLQYNFDHGDALERDEHSLWLQLEYLLGAHAAHKF